MRMTRPSTSLLTLAAALGLAACANQPVSDKAADPGAAPPKGAVALGNNAIGEACRAEPVAARGSLSLFDVFCGTWDEPSAQVWSQTVPAALPVDKAAWQAQVLALSQRTDWAARLARKASCHDPVWTADGTTLVATCQLREGGWPHVGITTVQGGRLVQADGLPSVADLVTASLPLLAGGAPAAVAEGAEAPGVGGKVAGVLGASATRFGKGDLKSYQSLTEQGRLGNSLENFSAAESAYRRALEVQSRILGEDSPGVGDTLMNLALEVSNQGRIPEADGLFRRADALLQRSFDRSARAQLVSYRAFHALNAGDAQRALAVAKEASAVRRDIVRELEGDDPTGQNRAVLGNLTVARGDLIHSLILEGTIAVRLRQPALVERVAAEAQRVFDRTPGLPAWWQSRIHGLRGLGRAAGGDLDGAERFLVDGVQANRQLFGETWPTASLMLDLGKVQAEGGRTAEALASFRAAFAIIAAADQPPAQLPFDRIAPFLTAALAEAGKHPDQAAALHAEMFTAAQLVREGAVGQTITRASARFATDDPAVSDLVRRQQDAARGRDRLRLELAAETARPDAERDAARAQSLKDRLDAVSREAVELEREMRARFPDYARLTRFKATTAEELRAALSPGEGVVLFSLAQEGSFGFLVTRDAVTAYPVRLGRADAGRRVEALRAAFVPRQGKLLPFDLAQSHELYQRLLGPVAAELKGVERLVFVPSGPLLSLPPAVLVTAPARGEDYGRAAWLARDKALAVAPSVPAFISLRKLASRPAAPLPFVGFAAPPFQGKAGPGSAGEGLSALGRECRTGAPVDPALLRALAPLPETADEIRSIGRQLGATPDSLLTGAAVTKAAVRGLSLRDYRVLYFATHGLLPGELRCQAEPGLALAPPAGMPKDTADDGLLTASDVALLRLNADLVVLSACNTAGGDGRFGGESLSGLAESFFFAGARNILVTHWQVPSEPTVALMQGLFAGALDGGKADAAGALARSQMALAARTGTGHPFFWGAFTVIGDGVLSPSTLAGGTRAAGLSLPPKNVR